MSAQWTPPVDSCPEHPHISAACRTGYPPFLPQENQDSPEARQDYIEEHTSQLIGWLRLGYPEILDEFIEMSGQLCRESYQSWLN